ncbi:MAG TPA: hypothetical protein DEO88_13680 [Syntrophobacteraceae bacterium]|nr:hypothetical protein [Syntrophobacteraceae bacterium]
MIKIVMGSIMLIVAVSRGLAIPTYLNKLGLMSITTSTDTLLTQASFIIMCIALSTGALIILGSMWKATRAERTLKESYAKA